LEVLACRLRRSDLLEEQIDGQERGLDALGAQPFAERDGEVAGLQTVELWSSHDLGRGRGVRSVARFSRLRCGQGAQYARRLLAKPRQTRNSSRALATVAC